MGQDEEIEKAKQEMQKTAHETAMESTGACVYNAGGKTYCAVLSEDNCRRLRGAFFPGRSC